MSLLSSTSLAASHPWINNEVLRVVLEGKGPVGFIEINEETTLENARALIAIEVEGIANDAKGYEFVFLLPDGVPISKRQESRLLARDFLPTVLIRASKRIKNGTICGVPLVDSDINNCKVNVEFQGSVFRAWLTTGYTFQHLRSDASRYWGFPKNQVVLTDEDGCAWPDMAELSNVLSIGLLENKRIILVPKDGKALNKNSHDINPNQTEEEECKESQVQIDRFFGSDKELDSRYAHLWRIFTFQCAQGDGLRPLTMDCSRFVSFARNCQIPSRLLPSARLHLIYATNCSGKNRMGFENFLDALVDLASRLYPNQEKGASLLTLLGRNVFPNAQCWPLKIWAVQNERIHSKSLHKFFSQFALPLWEIFRFYTPGVRSHRLDVEADASMTLKEFSLFALDFQFSNMNLRSAQIGEVFLASVQDPGIPLYERFLRRKNNNMGNEDSPNKTSGSGSYMASTNKGESLYNRDGTPIWENPVMYFDQFVGALARTSLVAFGSYDGVELPAERSVKALLQHFSNILRQAYVTEIAEKRAKSANPAGLMRGTTELTRRFHKIWSQDDQENYASAPKSPRSDSEGDDDSTRGERLHSINTPSSTQGRKNRFSSSGSIFNTRNSSLQSPRQTSNGHRRTSLSSGRKVLAKLAKLEKASESSALSSLSLTNANKGTPTLSSIASCMDYKSESKTKSEEHENTDDIGRFALHNDEPMHALTSGRRNNSEHLENTSPDSASICEREAPSPQQQHHKNTGQASSPRSQAEGQGSAGDSPLSNDLMSTSSNSSFDATPHEFINTQQIQHVDICAMDCEHVLDGHRQPCHAQNFNSRSYQCSSGKDGSLSIELKPDQTDFRSILLQGGVFLKHGRRGNPHRRYVWCDEKLEKVHWCTLKDRMKARPRGKSISISSIEAISTGRDTRVFKRDKNNGWPGFARIRSRWPSNSGKGPCSSEYDQPVGVDSSPGSPRDNLCFSIVTKSRTLDLETDCEESREVWVSAFQQLLDSREIELTSPQSRR